MDGFRRSVAVGITNTALTMGPRNRRRLRNGAVAAGAVVIAVLAVVVLMTRHSSNDSGSAVTAQAKQQHTPTNGSSRELHLVFGMTPRQVRHIAGNPRTTRGACWYYKPVHGTVGSLTTGVPGTPSMTANQIKLCFFSGVLSFEFTHLLTPDKGWQWIDALF
jgi:hypothetical protein